MTKKGKGKNHLGLKNIIARKNNIMYNNRQSMDVSMCVKESERKQMSQAKVDRQKEYKKNRKEIMTRQKQKKMLGRIASYLCVLGVVLLLGLSVYRKMNPAPEPDASTFYNLTATDSYGILNPSMSE